MYTVTLILTRMLLLLPTDICSSSSDTLMDKQKKKDKIRWVHSKQESPQTENQYVQ